MTPTHPAGHDERVLVLMPTARDAERTASALAAAGLSCALCDDVAALCQGMAEGCGAALLPEEVLAGASAGRIAAAVRQQPPWSDLPLVVLAHAGAGDRPTSFRESLNVTLVERPVRLRSLLTVLRSALRARRRQYEVREHLAERVLAAEALRLERERYRVTLAGIGDAVIATDTEARVTFLNPVAEQLTGWVKADAVGRPLTDVFRIINETSRRAVEYPALRAVREGVIVGLANHTLLIARDGSERPIDDSAGPIRDVSGGTVGAVLVFRDVTERRRAEHALRASEGRHRFLAELAAATQGLAEPDEVVSVTARLLAEHLGADRCAYAEVEDEAVFVITGDHPRGVPSIVGRWPVAAFGAECLRLMLANQPYVVNDSAADPRIGPADLPAYQAATIAAAICVPLHKQGKFTAAMAVHQRVPRPWTPAEVELVTTVVGRCWEVLERVRVSRDLRNADRQKNEFIALLAHELRNPLAPLRNGLEVLRLAEEDAAAAARAREMMRRQLVHMVRLVDDLLDVSRISRNKLELRRQRVSLADVVESALETARPAIDAAGHRLTVELPPEPIQLDADLTRLAQVFGNLLTNSAKYTERGGRIWLTAARREGAVEVSVRDTGVGIPAAALGNLFAMFSQVDRNLERTTGGLGIGLALVKGLVEMHGGTVEAASAGRGQGSTFTVRLPVSDGPTEAAPTTPDDEDRHDGLQRRILVVDDNRDSAESMALMLRLLGNEVATAHDGEEAVEQAERFRPAVVLMDVGMPRLNGLDATRRIREQPWGQGMVIFALTGWGQDGDREQSRQAGCDGHLVKPVDLAELKRLLTEVAARHGAVQDRSQ